MRTLIVAILLLAAITPCGCRTKFNSPQERDEYYEGLQMLADSLNKTADGLNQYNQGGYSEPERITEIAKSRNGKRLKVSYELNRLDGTPNLFTLKYLNPVTNTWTFALQKGKASFGHYVTYFGVTYYF